MNEVFFPKLVLIRSYIDASFFHLLWVFFDLLSVEELLHGSNDFFQLIENRRKPFH